MTIDITLPNLGEGVDEAEITDVFISEGDIVQADQNIMEVGSDKATVEVPTTTSGKVVKVHVSAGDTVNEGAKLVSIEPAEATAAQTAPPPAPEPPAAKPTPAPAPPAPEPTPAPPEATSPPPAAPVQPVAPAPAPAQPSAPVMDAPATTGNGANIPAGPAIRRFAREVGVDLSNVTGTGPGGRIQREDVLQVVRQTTKHSPGKAGSAGTAQDEWGPIRVERLSKIRKTISKKMHESWTTVPRVTNFDDADVTELESIRQSSKEDYLRSGIKLTTLPFLLKAVAMSLRAHPTINASVDLDAGQVTYKEYVNIGIAVDTDNGLMVPVLRDVDTLSIPDIARGMAEMVTKVRDNKFSVEDLRGGMFSVSNLGAIGGSYSTPIVNVPEVAILLVGRSRKLPMVMENDEIAPRLMMPLSLSYDHRLVDGGAAGRFLNEVISYLEAPSRLLLAP